MKQLLRTGMLVLALACGGTMAAYGQQSKPVVAITHPVDDVTMSFAQPVQIARIEVKEGDSVKAGQTLVVFDDREELATYNKAKAEAENMTRVEVQKAILAQKQVELKKLQDTNEKLAGSVTPWEIDEAQINVKVEEAKLKLEEKNHENAQHDLAAAKAKLDKMTLLSPIDGRVEKIYLEVGESVESGNTKVIHIEKRDPLKVEGNVKFAAALGLKKGDPAEVVFSDNTKASGHVTFVSGVADAASETLRVTVEVPNPQERPAGEQVEMIFPAQRLAQRP